MKDSLSAAALAIALIAAAIGMSGFYESSRSPEAKPAQPAANDGSAATNTVSVEQSADAVSYTNMTDGIPLAVDLAGKYEPGIRLDDSRPGGVTPLSVAHTPPAPPHYPQPAVPAGHWEQRGLFGRRSVWVTNQPQPQRQSQPGTTACFNCAGRK